MPNEPREPFPRLAAFYSVCKKDKRLWVYCEYTCKLVYTPPDFLRHRIQSRSQLAAPFQRLVYHDQLFDAIFEFESSFK